ncbi:MAG: hypothetical protein KZQ97_17000 [Candidatus Thiodiazotropha sp. (ex Dulcina madagascariensis)]|nr:hypothetical protein [Candidatus Thiodiazotropha sp. (ex Dulcina madagascariensis)]
MANHLNIYSLHGRRGDRREWQDLNRLEVALREMGFSRWSVVNELDK